MPDSWILVVITVLIVFILFYMSNRMICLTAKARESAEEKNQQSTDTSIHYIQSESLPSSPRLTSIHDLSNNNCKEEVSGCGTLQSRVESRLRSQMFNLLLAEKEHQQLELDVRRLAQVLSISQDLVDMHGDVERLREHTLL
ncbi:unnamed protein product [Allacma fusca]|uniref:Uncharacterized protein n=1 Tax=Allacma fusca TaxID=39272 RepID=A0A8J2KXB2_9HEXA|nr:unnamed protein product [Allacma fusca]